MPTAEQRLSVIGGRVQEQTARFGEIAEMFRHVDGKIDESFRHLDGKIDVLRVESANQFKWIIGIMVTLAGLFAAFGR